LLVLNSVTRWQTLLNTNNLKALPGNASLLNMIADRSLLRGRFTKN
jgi:hypothetical protein